MKKYYQITKIVLQKKVKQYRSDNLDSCNLRAKKYRDAHKEEQKILHKKWRKTKKGKRSAIEQSLKYKKLYPGRIIATAKVNHALRDNRLEKQPCFICGSDKVHGHHYDYSKPLDVIWLCPTHHMWMHKRNIQCQK